MVACSLERGRRRASHTRPFSSSPAVNGTPNSSSLFRARRCYSQSIGELLIIFQFLKLSSGSGDEVSCKFASQRAKVLLAFLRLFHRQVGRAGENKTRKGLGRLHQSSRSLSASACRGLGRAQEIRTLESDFRLTNLGLQRLDSRAGSSLYCT